MANKGQTLANAYIAILPSFEGLQKSLESAFSNVNTKALGTKLGSGVSNSFTKTFGEVKKSITDVFSASAGAAANATGAAIGMLGLKGVQSAAQLQTLQIQMNGLTKSMDLGKQAMAGAYAYAQKAPFQLPEVAGATKTLIAYGIQTNKAVDMLDMMGNVSITTGADLQGLANVLGQVSAAGKLGGQDLLQFTSNGVAMLPALAESLGKTMPEVKKMMEDGAVSFEMVTDAMASLVDPAILSQLENTLPRQLDRIGGSVRMLSNAFVGVTVNEDGFTAAAGGIYQAVINITRAFADLIRNSEVMESARKAGEALAPIFQKLADLIPTLVAPITGVFNAISSLGPALIPILLIMLAKFGSLASSIPVVGEFIKPLTNAFTNLGKVSSDVLGKLGKSIGNLVPNISKIIQFAPKGLMFLADGFGKVAVGVGNLILKIRPLNAAFSTSQAVIKNFATKAYLSLLDVTGAAETKLKNAIEKLPPIFSKVGGAIKDTFDKLTPTFKNLGDKISGAFKTAKDNIKGVLDTTANLAKGLVSTVGSIASKLGGAVVGFGALMAVAQKFSNEDIGAKVTSFMNELPGKISQTLASLNAGVSSTVVAIPEMVEAFTSAIPQIMEALQTALPALGQKVTEAIPIITEALKTGVPILLQAGFDIITSIINGITQTMPELIKMFTALVGIVADTLMKNLPALIDSGIQLLGAIGQGILDNLDMIIDSTIEIITTLLTAIIDNLPKIIEGGLKLVMGLVNGLVNNIDKILEATVKLIVALAGAIIDNLPMIVKTGIELVVTLAGALIKAVPKLLAAGWDLIVKLFQKITSPGSMSKMLEAGKNLIQGIINGVGNMVNAAVDAVKDVGNKMLSGLKGVLGIASPSKVTTSYGKFLMMGLDNGMKNNLGTTLSAVKSIGESIKNQFSKTKFVDTNVLKKGFDDVANNISAKIANIKKSLSEMDAKFKKTAAGKEMIKSLKEQKEALESNLKSIKSVTKAIKPFNDAMKAAQAGNVDKVKSAITSMAEKLPMSKDVKNLSSQLVIAAGSQSILNDKLKDAQAQLKDAKKAMADYAKSIADTFKSFGNLSNVAEGATNAGDYLKGLQDNVQLAYKFKDDLRKLQKLGLNQLAIDDIMSKGVEGGLKMTDTLLNGADKDMIKKINDSMNEIAKQGTVLGKELSNTFYGDGVATAQSLVNGITAQQKALSAKIDELGVKLAKQYFNVGSNSAKGIVKGIQSEQKNVVSAMTGLGSAMTAAINKALKIKSPSRVMAQVGKFTDQGIGQGLTDNMKFAIKPMENMADKMIKTANGIGGQIKTKVNPVVQQVRYDTSNMKVPSDLALAGGKNGNTTTVTNNYNVSNPDPYLVVRQLDFINKPIGFGGRDGR